MTSKRFITIHLLFTLCFIICLVRTEDEDNSLKSYEEEVYGVKYANDCEGLFIIYDSLIRIISFMSFSLQVFSH